MSQYKTELIQMVRNHCQFLYQYLPKDVADQHTSMVESLCQYTEAYAVRNIIDDANDAYERKLALAKENKL